MFMLFDFRHLPQDGDNRPRDVRILAMTRNTTGGAQASPPELISPATARNRALASMILPPALALLAGLLSGSLNPMAAFMQGKFKIEGDMGVAMRMQSVFGGR